MFLALNFVVFILIQKFPTKMAPIFFVICWFDEVLLILIHGFAWFQVDLASPQVSPSFMHEISSFLTPKSAISAQNRIPKLASRVDQEPRTTDAFRMSGAPGTTGRLNFSGRPEPLTRAKFMDFRARPDVRPPDIRPFTDVYNLKKLTSLKFCFGHN